jgi:hypothetical protein
VGDFGSHRLVADARAVLAYLLTPVVRWVAVLAMFPAFVGGLAVTSGCPAP